MPNWSLVRLLLVICCQPFITATANEVNTQDNTCEDMLKNFAKSSAAFNYCTISHARPILVCQKCVSQYLDVVGAYNNITKLGKTAGRYCTSELKNLDRLHIFEQGFDYIDRLWRSALCNNCFVMNGDTGYPTSQLTDLVERILNASGVYKACVDNYRIKPTAKPDLMVCDNCAGNYTRVNDIFNKNKGTIPLCMDIIDLMNSTRNVWSKDFGCCLAREKPETTMILVAMGVGVLPFVFYLMTYCLTPEEVHPVIEKKRWNEDW